MKLSCKDIDPNIDCGFEAHGASEEEVAMKMMNHMKNAHPDEMKEMKMSNDEIMKTLESKVHE
jgi:predicted small metal-binding protein